MQRSGWIAGLMGLALTVATLPAHAVTAGNGLPPGYVGATITKLPTTARTVALTFDAGSGNQGVASILDTLARERVPATFFLTGRFATTFPDSARRIAALGNHVIGNHTITHPHITALTDAQVVQEVSGAAGILRTTTGRDPAPLFRFPFGEFDARTLADANSLGYASISWTVDTLGWEGSTNPTTGLSTGQSVSTVVSRAVGAATPGEIILMHMGASEDGTTLDAAALPGIIDGLRRLGYGFTTVWDALYAGTTLAGPVAGAATSGPFGFWATDTHGGNFQYGSARFLGSTSSSPLNYPVVGMAGMPSGAGYWNVASDGGIFAFGDAGYFGSMGDKKLNNPVVGMARTPSGGGYWEVASDGGIFAFGNAGYFGSMGGRRLNSPVVGMAATPDGGGYWLVAADGGIFAFGSARFLGSQGASPLNSLIVGMAATPDGGGYWLVAADGGIFAYGDAAFLGSAGSTHLDAPIVAMAATPSGNGYWLVDAVSRAFNYGAAPALGTSGAD